jgi:hypothetical protein
MSNYVIKDSGNRRKFPTGSQRDMAAGKGRLDLLWWHSILEVAKHFENGAIKYNENNWRLGQNLSIYFDSATRHLAKYACGETDEPHDLAAFWNIGCLIETKHRIDKGELPKELDNFPYLKTKASQKAPNDTKQMLFSFVGQCK